MGHESSLPYGSPVMLNCTTDLAVDTIEWLDMKGTVLANGNDSLLELTDIPVEVNNLAYTCRVTSMFGVHNKTVTLHIIPGVMSSPILSNTVPAIIVIVMLAVLALAVVVVIVIVR